MEFIKQKIYRSPKLLSYAKNSPCQNPACCKWDGTTVAAHYSGPNSGALGKGTSQKASDLAVSFLCYSCHTAVDTGVNAEGVKYDPEERLILWTIAHCRTLEWLAREGLLHVGESHKQK